MAILFFKEMVFIYYIYYKFSCFANVIGGYVIRGVELLKDERGFLLCNPHVVVS